MLRFILHFAFEGKLDAEMTEDILGIVVIKLAEIDPVLAIIDGPGSLGQVNIAF